MSCVHVSRTIFHGLEATARRWNYAIKARKYVQICVQWERRLCTNSWAEHTHNLCEGADDLLDEQIGLDQLSHMCVYTCIHTYMHAWRACMHVCIYRVVTFQRENLMFGCIFAYILHHDSLTSSVFRARYQAACQALINVDCRPNFSRPDRCLKVTMRHTHIQILTKTWHIHTADSLPRVDNFLDEETCLDQITLVVVQHTHCAHAHIMLAPCVWVMHAMINAHVDTSPRLVLVHGNKDDNVVLWHKTSCTLSFSNIS